MAYPKAIGTGIALLFGLSLAWTPATAAELLTTICHYPPDDGAPHTLTLSANSAPEHLDHGDTFGSCGDDTELTLKESLGPRLHAFLSTNAAVFNVTVCHHWGTDNQETIVIPAIHAAVRSHLTHDDRLGECEF